MGFDHVLRIVASLQNIVAVCANVLLAYLITYRSNGHVKSHKEVLLITSFHSAMFSAVMLVLQPVLLVGDGHIIAFSNGPLRASSKHVSYASAVALFTALDVTVVCIAVQFIARYKAICKAVGRISTSGCKYRVTIVAAIWYILKLLLSLWVCYEPDDSREAVISVVRSNIWPAQTETKMVLYFYNELVCCLLGYVVVVVCDWKIMKRLKSVEVSSVHHRYAHELVDIGEAMVMSH
ncbi:Protein STR-19 [Aphelenchoides avenae]|nr:Protein STR-19 [Aphelenchus avenae]